MTRRRTFIFVLGVCIGTLLIFFDNAAAEVTEASVASEKSESQKVSPTPQGSTTILTKVSSIHQNRSFAKNDERNIELTNRKTHDAEDRSHDIVIDSANQDGKKDDVPTHVDSHPKKTNDESESLSSDGNRKPRYGEIAVESSGKSTSTKVISEDLLRPSRKNELTAATAKPAFNDSKQDNKNLENASLQESFNHEKISDTTKAVSPNTKEKMANEKLIANVMGTLESKEAGKEFSVTYEERNNGKIADEQEILTVKSIGDFFSTTPKSTSEEAVRSNEKSKLIKLDHKEVISRKDKNTILTDLNEEREATTEARDRELTTVRGENSPGFKKDVGTTASEVLDLEKIDEKGLEGSVSLVNDTYVNYNSFYVTEKDPKASPGNRSNDVNESSEKGDPKEEVEIVKNVTQVSVLRIVTTANDTTKNDSHVNELRNTGAAAYVKKKGETSAKDENHPEQSVDFSISNVTIKNMQEWKSIGEPESQVKLPETTTQSVRVEEHTSSVPETTPNLIPQGRTIGFSRINEFPNIEMKTTASVKTDGGPSVIKRLQNSTEKIDQRPYPYLKSGRESFQVVTEASLKVKKKDGDITEETSAYENTIGKGESEKKLVITEPSVVIENSIQQHNPNKKNLNESTNATTKSLSSLTQVTAVPMVSTNVERTNETFPEGFNDSAKAAEMKRSKTNENDTSGAKEEEKVVVGKDEGYDVTGNGITEVSLIPDGKEVKSHSGEATESSTLHSAETNTSKTMSLNTDVQMEPEEAMMIRSTFVVTESTSVVPLDKDATTETNKSKTWMTSAAEVNTIATTVVEKSPEPAPKLNVTLRPSASVNYTTESPSTTLNPDESTVPTTTSIEFEFVSLTEAISSGSNATERSVEGRTFEEQTMLSRTTTIQNPFAANNSTEDAITTMDPEYLTELPVTTEDGTPTTDQVLGMHVDNITTSRASLVTQATSESQSNRTESARNEVTVSVIDFTSSADDNATAASGVTEDPSKNPSFDANITETSAPGATKLPPNTGDRIATDVTKGPSATSTLEPIVLWSTVGFTESPEEEITESIQTLSPDEITLLVKIVIEGTLHEVCPRLPELRKALADVLRDGLEKPVQPKQIVIHQNPCPEQNSSPTSTEVSLIPIMIYVVDENGKFDAAMTKILPSLYKVSPNFPVRVHKFLLVSEADSGNAIAVVVVSSVAFICLVLLAGLLFIMRKRQTRFNYGERCRPVSLDAYSLDSVSAYNSVRRKGAARSSKRSYGNPTFEDSSAIPSHPLNFAGLSSFCNDVNTINEEFAGIPQVSAKIDELPPGAEVKNRYANVIPLPETRVPLQRLNNDALTEYINASYVRGPKNATKYYVACQAPIESTVTDFWRMIWEQQSKVIIMLTDLVENEVEKCTEYIPPSEVTDCHRLYGDFQVTLKKRETKEKYAISSLHLKNLENNTFREVFHIWYLWPVTGVQSDGTGLIAVLLEARALQRGGPGPIVVHCSPGTGRTGTLIALDLGIRQYEITRTVDVPRVVYTIRRDRAGAVQTKEQYAFIYKALNLYATKLAGGGVLEST